MGLPGCVRSAYRQKLGCERKQKSACAARAILRSFDSFNDRQASRVTGPRHAIANPLKLHRPLRHACGEVERPQHEPVASYGCEPRPAGAYHRRLAISLNVMDHVLFLFIRLVGATVSDEAFEGRTEFDIGGRVRCLPRWSVGICEDDAHVPRCIVHDVAQAACARLWVRPHGTVRQPLTGGDKPPCTDEHLAQRLRGLPTEAGIWSARGKYGHHDERAFHVDFHCVRTPNEAVEKRQS